MGSKTDPADFTLAARRRATFAASPLAGPPAGDLRQGLTDSTNPRFNSHADTMVNCLHDNAGAQLVT